ncbi:MAG TPA: DUF2723 domain-containing protein [Saprospiraceae bacterium]|nr:MAG: DMT(drug/metabolite transporter) superfamily permease [Candidatus Parvibacillus calidus]MCC7148730.1 DUF2723 domain-containing protein [Saprospiraceae bacterium]HRN34709.1 DUF2723 domain-containing protein [Saprospiraceae bacterium]HRP83743.1 DUF2723 domain-containing protein [Saprospiraceae bacterium]
MNSFNRALNIAGWLTFAITFMVFVFAVERTGSLWDCGEFILGAYKLQVVHPPGAPLFLMIGRMFAYIGSMFTSTPANIAFAVNLMSGLLTAFAGMFICWTTMYLGKLSLVGRGNESDSGQNIGLLLAGLVAGLTSTFCISVWFSAMEGEVYAMSTFFTALTLWSLLKWYYLPDTQHSDRWIVFSLFMAGLSIGVHLLSILTFPALAIFYYLKKFNKFTWTGLLISIVAGLVVLFIVQRVIIVGLPDLLVLLDIFAVNSLGLPFYSGLVPFFAIIGGLLYWGIKKANSRGMHNLQLGLVSLMLIIVAYSTTTVAVIRANANPPINMNNPSDPARLVPYLNREQYGDRPLLFGPSFDAKPIGLKSEPRYGRVGDKYEVIDMKYEYEYKPEDNMFFPRMGHGDDPTKVRLYKQWMGHDGKPTMGDNLSFFWRYQLGWMYWRYFMWNFVGKQNGDQGYVPWDKSKGNWLSGISFIDNTRLGNQDQLPSFEKNNQARNKYYFLPFILGIIGTIFHLKRRRNDWIGLFMLFIITGIGIIVYSNQPPIEPRERDYVLVGSFFTFAIWVGLGGLAIGEFVARKIKHMSLPGYAVAGLIALLAPTVMAFQNYDDMGRRGIYASRDYAANFLNSVGRDAIIFTYGDNDTYPLWYAQEVEGIRPDVRVVNLSLIAVDWYIEGQRRKINESPYIKMTIPSDSYRGNKRNQVYYVDTELANQELPAEGVLRFIGESHPLEGSGSKAESFLPTKNVYIPIDKAKWINKKFLSPQDSILDRLPLSLGVKEQGDYILKGDLAVMDIIASNINDRPIYFSVTADPSKFLGLNNFMQLEGLALRIVPVRSNSDRQFGVFGTGRVQTDTLYNNVMKKFRWGNFEKKKLFVDRSYTPTVNALRMIQMRAAFDMISKGDKKRAADLAENTLKVFPNMNFPFDGAIIPALSMLTTADNIDRAKPYMKQLAENLREKMVYFHSMTPVELSEGYQADKEETESAIADLMDMIGRSKDQGFEEEIRKIIGPYIPKADGAIPKMDER